MKEIVPANVAVMNLIGKQKFEANKYRNIKFLLSYKVKNGLLIYNIFTGALILLTEEEAQYFNNYIYDDSEISKFLVENWCVVPDDFDENALSDQVNSLMRMMVLAKTDVPITGYSIFPTTDCNARCFYCFERMCNRISMTPQTASDVADFIEKSCKGQPVSIRWFGGEPTYNDKAIDIICTRLAEKGIEFSSKMVTNGYLFDEKMVDQAKNLWHLRHAKVALDGTEKIYNRYKAFIYKDGSAFVKVTDNIERLLKAGIEVTVRLNMDDHNSSDLYTLADQLYDRFGKYKGFSFDLHLLFDCSTKKTANRTEDERHELIKKFNALKKYLEEKIPPVAFDLASVRRWKQCMADDPASTTILPDGRLGKCDSFTDEHFWGSIYNDEINQREIDVFKEMKRPDGGEKCLNCPIRPVCDDIVLCIDHKTKCDEFDRQMSINAVTDTVFGAYNKYLEGSNQDEA